MWDYVLQKQYCRAMLSVLKVSYCPFLFLPQISENVPMIQWRHSSRAHLTISNSQSPTPYRCSVAENFWEKKQHG